MKLRPTKLRDRIADDVAAFKDLEQLQNKNVVSIC